MDKYEALELLELSESPEPHLIQAHYRLLRGKGHPDSSSFDGVVRNLARIKEACDFLMGNTQNATEQYSPNRSGENSGLDKLRADVNNWLKGFFAKEKEKKNAIASLIGEYDLTSIIGNEDPFAALLTNEFDEHFLERLYRKDTSLDKEFGTHFYRIKSICYEQGFDFNKFICFFEDQCIPCLLSELAFKHGMDSGNGIDFFVGWGEDILHSYESSRSLIGLIDDNPDLFRLYPYFVSEVRKYYQKVTDQKQSEFMF